MVASHAPAVVAGDASRILRAGTRYYSFLHLYIRSTDLAQCQIAEDGRGAPTRDKCPMQRHANWFRPSVSRFFRFCVMETGISTHLSIINIHISRNGSWLCRGSSRRCRCQCSCCRARRARSVPLLQLYVLQYPRKQML